jgi:hypothetical protein
VWARHESGGALDSAPPSLPHLTRRMSAATYAAPAAVASATAGRAARRARVGAKVGTPRGRSGTFSHGCFLLSGAARLGETADPWRRAGCARAPRARAPRARRRADSRGKPSLARTRDTFTRSARVSPSRVVPRRRRLDTAHPEPTNQRSPNPLPPRSSSQASRATRKSVTTAALSEPPFQAMVRPDTQPHPSPAPRPVPPPATQFPWTVASKPSDRRATQKNTFYFPRDTEPGP